MKALTLWQPWASLVALGVKTVETRCWSTRYRGPLAIHAAATTKGFDVLPGDREGTVEGGWRYGYIGDFQAAYCFRSSDEGRRGDAYVHDLSPSAADEPTTVPLGAVVATCTLLDVVPMVGPSCDISAIGPRHVFLSPDPQAWLLDFDRLPNDPDVARCVTDQLPYGDFTPGRFAWLLSNVVPLPEPVPARGRQQVWEWTP